MIYCKSQMFDENIYHFSPSDTCNYLYNRTFQQQPSAAFTVTAVQYSGWLSLIGAWIWQPSMKKIYSLIYVAWKYDILVLSAWTNSKHFQLISDHLLHTHWSFSVGTYKYIGNFLILLTTENLCSNRLCPSNYNLSPPSRFSSLPMAVVGMYLVGAIKYVLYYIITMHASLYK